MTVTTAMSPHGVTETPLVLDERARALFAGVAADPYAPLCLGVPAPGGYGKSVLLEALAQTYRRAGLTVVAQCPDQAYAADPDQVLLVDDAHLLDDARLRALCGLLEAGRPRLVVGYRPWPQSAALAELADLLRRSTQPLLLAPFTTEQTADYLAGASDLADPAVTGFVQAQTGGIPRDVDRLARGLREHAEWVDEPTGGGTPYDASALDVPQPVVLQFGPELDGLDPEVRGLLLAAAAGGPLPADLLGELLDRDPEAVDGLLAEARATGLLGPDGRVSPIVCRAVAMLSPAAHREAVWQRLAELRLARGGPVLPLVRSLLDAGVAGGCPAAMVEAAAEEAITDEPAYAVELFAAANAGGRAGSARQATAAALAGDLDSALRLADRLVATAGPAERAEAAAVAATALAHRGHLGRSAELFRWSGTASTIAYATIGALGTGQLDGLDQTSPAPTGAPPTLVDSAATLMARGLRESLGGLPTAALSALVQASALLEPAGRAALLPDSPAALAALAALHCGELEIGERTLDRAVAARMGGPLMARRHRLLQGWIEMVRGRTGTAQECLAAVTADGRPLEPRDLLFGAAMELGIARRNSDLPGLRRAWGYAREAVVRHPVDLFTLLPLGELAIAAARLGELGQLSPYLAEARLLLDRLGGPAFWATPLHWSCLHAAIAADERAAADEHAAALTRAADHSRYAAVLAAAAGSWLKVSRGVVDPVRVEAAARGLHGVGLCWDAARLAGQAAIHTSDRKAMTALLDCARMLQGRSAGRPGGASPDGTEQLAAAITTPDRDRLSDREREVAELVLAGLTYRQIGDRLFISAKTVEHHVARMRSRLDCANRSELLARLREIVTVTHRADADPATPPGPRR